MKLEKKIVAMLLVVLLALSTVACGDKEDKKPAESTAPKTEITETKEPTKTEISTETEGVVTTEEVLTDSPVSITTEPMETEEELGIDLSNDAIKKMILNGLTMIREGKGADLAKHAPSFTPESWLQSERYTANEADGTTVIEVLEIEGAQFFSEETILDVYENTMLSFEIENSDALKGVDSIAAFQYTYKYKTADGKEEVGAPDGISDFLMAYEEGKWKYVFVDDVPEAILNYNLSNSRDFYLGDYKFNGTAEDSIEFKGGEDWTMTLEIGSNEQGDTFLQLRLMGDGQEWSDIYFLMYDSLGKVVLCKEYDADNYAFQDYTLEADMIPISLTTDTISLTLSDASGNTYTLNFTKPE